MSFEDEDDELDRVLEDVLRGHTTSDILVYNLTEKWVGDHVLVMGQRGLFPTTSQVVQLVDRYYPLARALVARAETLGRAK